jgi:hypothetical protein
VLSDFSPFTIGFGSFSVLSVDLLGFEASAIGNSTQLNWRVGNTGLLSHFEVEWGQNGTNFQSIRRIGPHSGNAYRMRHTPASHGIHFYRLKVVDKKGSIQFSEVKAVSLEKSTLPLISWLHAGVGAQSGYLEAACPHAQHLQAVLFDAAGRSLKTFRFWLLPGNNTLEIPLHFLPKGLYYLQVSPQQGGAKVFSLIK